MQNRSVHGLGALKSVFFERLNYENITNDEEEIGQQKSTLVVKDAFCS